MTAHGSVAPARVSMPLIDVMVCTTCELRCVACTNHIGGLDRLTIYPAELVERDITAAAAALHAEVAVLLGGEPLQHPQLLRLLRYAKASGIADRVRVLTNGIKLHRQPDEFWRELDDLKVSIYPGKTPPENVELAQQRARELGFAFSVYDVAAAPFRGVLTRGLRTAESAQIVYDACWYRHNTRKLEQGYLWRCCTSPTIAKNVLGIPPDVDAIALDGLEPDRLQAFLDQREAMASCMRCHGNLGPQLDQWSEERDRVKWIERSSV